GLRAEGGGGDGPPPSSGAVPVRLLQVAAGLGVLLVGADVLVSSAVSVARHFGMREAVIGVTIVAIGTSAPELATSVVAALRKEADIAVGNVVGSNVFNILVIAGLTGALAPGGGDALGPLDLGFLLGTAILLLPAMATRFTIDRREGALLLASYVVYLVLLSASAP
ncbi:MAG: sodium:calcium antiporter, partial [Planctomycetota bacterium JB042]